MNFVIRFSLVVTGMLIFGFGVEFNITNQPYDIFFIAIGCGLLLGPVVYDNLMES